LLDQGRIFEISDIETNLSKAIINEQLAINMQSDIPIRGQVLIGQRIIKFIHFLSQISNAKNHSV